MQGYIKIKMREIKETLTGKAFAEEQEKTWRFSISIMDFLKCIFYIFFARFMMEIWK